MSKPRVPVFRDTRPHVSVHESPIGWTWEVWRDNKLIHCERSHRRPTFQEKQQLIRFYSTPRDPEKTVHTTFISGDEAQEE